MGEDGYVCVCVCVCVLCVCVVCVCYVCVCVCERRREMTCTDASSSLNVCTILNYAIYVSHYPDVKFDITCKIFNQIVATSTCMSSTCARKERMP